MPIERASTGFSAFPHRCQPGAVRFNDFAAANFGGSPGGCLSETSKLSSGAWSWHKYGKAIDRMYNLYDPAQYAKGKALADYAVANRSALGTQQVIVGQDIWDIEYGWRKYWHLDHMNHVHIAIGYLASQQWFPPGGGGMSPTGDDFDMDEKQFQRLVGGIQDGQKFAANMVIGAIVPLIDGLEMLLTGTNSLIAAQTAALVENTAQTVKVRQEVAAVKRLLQDQADVAERVPA